MPGIIDHNAIVRQMGALSAMLVLFPITAAGGGPAQLDPEACSKIAEGAARLACYDAAFGIESEEAQAAAEPAASQLAPKQATQTAQPAEATPAAVPATAAQRDSMRGDAARQDVPSAAALDRDDRKLAPLTDEVGLGQVDRGLRTEQESFRAEVTECGLNARGKYYFYFDNGQVWRQTDSGRQKFDDCKFSVTISKDTFGFKMRPDTGARPVRIKRLK